MTADTKETEAETEESAESRKLTSDPEGSVQEEVDKAPDGGWGWFVVVGATLVHILMGGVERATGVIYLEMMDRFQGSATATSWIFSIFSTLRPILGPLGSAFSNRFSCRVVVFVGGVMSALSLITSAFAPSITALYFTFGVLGGIGQSFAYTPSLIIVGYYFSKRRGLAVGLATSGVGLGTFLLTPLFEVLFGFYGYRGALLVMGGIVMNFVVAASLFRPLDLHRKILRHQRSVCAAEASVEGGLYVEHSKEGNSLSGGPRDCGVEVTKNEEPQENSILLLEIQTTDNENKMAASHREPGPTTNSSVLKRKFSSLKEVILTKEIKKGPKQPLLEISLLKDVHFLALCLCLLLFTIAYNSTFVFLPSLATAKGITKLQAASIVSVIGIVDAISRVLSSIILDLKKVKHVRLYVYNGVLVFTGIVCLVIPSSRTYLHFVVCGAVFGLLTGIYKSQKSVVIVDILGVEKLSSSFGLLLLFQGIGSLIGPTAGGILKDFLGTYEGAFYLGSVGIFLGAVVLGFGNLRKYLHDRRTHLSKSSL